MPSIADTAIEMVQWVFPEHAGAPGQIHGGRMMEWIAQVGTMAAARVARGTVALGSMDDIDFLHPVLVGEIAILRAQVEYVGRSSLEVGVRVVSENVVTGARAVTLNSHLVFVALGDGLAPRAVGDTITPAGSAEEALVEAARRRREERRQRFAARRARTAQQGGAEGPAGSGGQTPAHHGMGGPEPVGLASPDHGIMAPARVPLASHDHEAPRWRFESARAVLPEDLLFGSTMFAGKLLKDIDEAGGIVAMRYCRGLVMTACLDALDFYAPIATHEVVTFRAGLNHVGTSSLEVGVKVLAEVPRTGEVRHACSAYLTFVHLGLDRRPLPAPPFVPQTAAELRRWEEATQRRERRVARVKLLKATLSAAD
jgi:acyl-CoA hydrolase